MDRIPCPQCRNALCLLLTISALLQLLFVVPNMIEFALPTSDGVPLFLAYLGVIAVEPLLGLLFVLAARSLQRSDGAATEVAWRTGALDQALGPAKGSDLPYILPWMAGGALIVMGAIVNRWPLRWASGTRRRRGSCLPVDSRCCSTG